LLHELVPALKVTALLVNPTNPILMETETNRPPWPPAASASDRGRYGLTLKPQHLDIQQALNLDAVAQQRFICG